MLLVIDKITKKVIENQGTNSMFPDGNIPNVELKENEEFIKIHDDSEEAKLILSAYDYSFENSVLNVNKTIEQYLNEQKETPEYLIKQINEIRNQRNQLLSSCDWTQVLDSPLTEEKLNEWATYRQALRDFPGTVDLTNIEWPTQPQ